MPRLESLPPIVGPEPRVLILGSMPGARSLAAREYYAHPRNAFWPIMDALIGLDPALGYAVRTSRIEAAGIALWDVLKHCERTGSLDTRIVRKSEVPNAIVPLLARHPTIRLVALNGGKAQAAFRRHLLPRLDAPALARVAIVPLPSTSPAHAARSLAEKTAIWRAAIAAAL
jgi:hypoxanthine-DNA glycosylase